VIDIMFDFLNLEDKLLLTQFPRFARAPEFISTPLLRFTPHRILPFWGLTNGINAVMIECVHGGKHTCPQITWTVVPLCVPVGRWSSSSLRVNHLDGGGA
jgi:hypothetical protein